MKKHIIYFNRRFLTRLIVLILLIACHNSVYAQVQQKVAFKARTSQLAPGNYKGKSIYNLRGDFTMIGNSNLYKNPYSNNGGNGNNSMKFHKLAADDSGIKNSSSADLFLSGLNGSCTQIVYAGLYWSGKGNSNDGDTFDGLNKKKVKLKVPNKVYEDLTASDIFYGGTDVSGMYTAYVDITDKVRAAGVGTYAVANIATREGNEGGTGYYGGWGIVVIYENPILPWRNITVFDGFNQIKWDGARATSGWVTENGISVRPKITTYGTLDLSGFSAVQNGAVNIKMGMMAGEGDEDISGDVFEIRKLDSNNYTALNHGGNSTTNFFNSSIFTGDNPRNPNNKNNYGTDISMFKLPNDGNVLITNSQTTTRFRFGTTQDTYVIYNIVFAVDAYVPEVDGVNKNTSGVGNNGGVVPNQELTFDLEITNKGTDVIKNGKVEIPLPPNVHFVSATIDQTKDIKGNVNWSHPNSTDSNLTPGGTIIWNFGADLPSGDINKILAKLSYKIRVTNDCTLLTTVSGTCGLAIPVNGRIIGTGKTSGVDVNLALIREYGSGTCPGPIYDDYVATINLSDEFIANCPIRSEDGARVFKAFCSILNNVIPRAEITIAYPLGSKFYSQSPNTPGYESTEIIGDFPVNATSKLYYVVVYGMSDGCYLKLRTVLEVINTVPEVNDIVLCLGDELILGDNISISAIGELNNYSLYYFDSNDVLLTEIPNPTSAGAFNYKVAEGKIQNGQTCFGEKVVFTITINALPTVAKDVSNISTCENNDSSVSVTTTGVSNYKWEYASVTSPAVWNALDNSTFSSVISITNGTLNISHATKALNGIKVRLIGENATSCETTSNEISIEIKDCHAITNPMLPNKTKN